MINILVQLLSAGSQPCWTDLSIHALKLMRKSLIRMTLKEKENKMHYGGMQNDLQHCYLALSHESMAVQVTINQYVLLK